MSAMEAGIVRKAMIYLGVVDDDSPDLDICNDPPQPKSVQSGPAPATRKVTPMTDEPDGGPASEPLPARPAPPAPATRVYVVTPASFADAQEITDRFRDDQPVIVNLQGVDRDLTRRLVDFCSGVTYALDGSMEKIAHQVLLLTPSDVEVSADERQRWSARPPARAAARATSRTPVRA